MIAIKGWLKNRAINRKIARDIVDKAYDPRSWRYPIPVAKYKENNMALIIETVMESYVKELVRDAIRTELANQVGTLGVDFKQVVHDEVNKYITPEFIKAKIIDMQWNMGIEPDAPVKPGSEFKVPFADGSD